VQKVNEINIGQSKVVAEDQRILGKIFEEDLTPNGLIEI